MDRFVAEKMRVETALLEIERQRAKLMIISANAQSLRDHAATSITGIKTVTAESETAMTAVRETLSVRPPSR
jgi:hypothetical protein